MISQILKCDIERTAVTIHLRLLFLKMRLHVHKVAQNLYEIEENIDDMRFM